MSKEKYIMTETHKQKISKANKGQVPWNKGKHWSEIIKLKMSKIAKKIGTGRWILGRKRAYEEKKAIGEKLKNYYKTHIHHAKGKHCSLQHRKNVSKALTGRIFLERRGSGSPRWTGGKIKVNGYIKIYCPEHPFANKKYVLEHRLLVEKRLKRFLKSFESDKKLTRKS